MIVTMDVDTSTLRGVVAVLDMIGVAVFAITGALVAARKEMDPFGFIVVGTVTAIGGGTLRDLFLGIRPVFWVTDPSFLAVSIGAALATFWAARPFTRLYRPLLWMDAVGMAMFAVAGTQKAVALGAPPLVSAAMGVMTASFGGVMRDMLCGEKPLLFHREIYATAALAGSASYLALEAGGWLSGPLASAASIAVAFAVRAAALIWGLAMPNYRHSGE